MDSFYNNNSRPQSTSRSESFKDFLLISPLVQTHLKKVYLSLCFSLLASAVGAYLHIIWNSGGLLTILATLGCMCWLLAIPAHEEKKRVSLLMLCGLFQGASIGPLIKLVTDFNPSILVCAFVGSAIAFACFSGAAMLASREYLCLGGLLSSGVSILLWVHFASSIFGGSLAFKFQLYFGLVVFVGYMMFDTKDIIKKAHLGDLDYVSHALTLFTDFIAVFVRILTIMVYMSLSFSLLASALGTYLHIISNLGGLLTTFATLGCMTWLLAIPPHQVNQKKRVSLLMLSTLLQGASIGPFIKLAIDFNPSILVCAFVGSAIASACLSAAAMLASREYLYAGGPLSSGVRVLLWVNFASSIFGDSLAFEFQLYFGLPIFVGYIMLDTQDIIRKAHLGDLDYVSHAFKLFTDFIQVFVRIPIIMMRNSNDRAERRKKRRG